MTKVFSKIWIFIIFIVIFAGGIFTWQYLEMLKKEAELPEEITKEEIANWKIYRDKDFGFEIKYPSDWEFEQKIYSHFIPPFEIVKFKPINKVYKSPSGTISYVPISVEVYNKPYEVEEIASKLGKKILLINNLKFIEVEPEPGRPSHIFIADNLKKTGYVRITNFVRVITEMKAGITAKEESSYQAIFNQMLSTFRFIEKTEKEIKKEEPYIKLLFPKGEEVLETDKSYEIKWDSRGLEKIDIGIVGGQIVGPYWTGSYIIRDIDASLGKYYWTIPSDSSYVGNYWRVFVGELPLEKSGYFKVKPGKEVYDRSEGYFSIK